MGTLGVAFRERGVMSAAVEATGGDRSNERRRAVRRRHYVNERLGWPIIGNPDTGLSSCAKTSSTRPLSRPAFTSDSKAFAAASRLFGPPSRYAVRLLMERRYTCLRDSRANDRSCN